jgi:hypothetical protein
MTDRIQKVTDSNDLSDIIKDIEGLQVNLVEGVKPQAPVPSMVAAPSQPAPVAQEAVAAPAPAAPVAEAPAPAASMENDLLAEMLGSIPSPATMPAANTGYKGTVFRSPPPKGEINHSLVTPQFDEAAEQDALNKLSQEAAALEAMTAGAGADASADDEGLPPEILAAIKAAEALPATMQVLVLDSGTPASSADGADAGAADGGGERKLTARGKLGESSFEVKEPTQEEIEAFMRSNNQRLPKNVIPEGLADDPTIVPFADRPMNSDDDTSNESVTAAVAAQDAQISKDDSNAMLAAAMAAQDALGTPPEAPVAVAPAVAVSSVGQAPVVTDVVEAAIQSAKWLPGEMPVLRLQSAEETAAASVALPNLAAADADAMKEYHDPSPTRGASLEETVGNLAPEAPTTGRNLLGERASRPMVTESDMAAEVMADVEGAKVVPMRQASGSTGGRSSGGYSQPAGMEKLEMSLRGGAPFRISYEHEGREIILDVDGTQLLVTLADGTEFRVPFKGRNTRTG